MSNLYAASQINSWLDLVRSRFLLVAPDLLTLFDTYAQEARFGRVLITEDIKKLSHGAVLLEVGAGSMLLSCQLVSEGFKVFALEPTGSGFSHFDRMRAVILQLATEKDCLPIIIDEPAESLGVKSSFDYAFSVNVMEHVEDVSKTLSNIYSGLKIGSCYRFTCPNYLFPYEPHFNMPTLFSKRLTGWFFRERIINFSNLPDPLGTWKSLNWINTFQVSRVVARIGNFNLKLSKDALYQVFERMTLDSKFAGRRSLFVRNFISVVVMLRLHVLLKLIPTFIQPVMNVCILKVK